MKYCSKCKKIYFDFEGERCPSCNRKLIDEPNHFSPVYIITANGFELERIRAALESAESFDEFYNALAGTRYQKPLDIFKNGNAVFTISSLENALYRYLCSETKRIIKENFDGKDEKKLLDVFKMNYDFKMIESIYRMKKYFHPL